MSSGSKFAVVGTGHRSVMYIDALASEPRYGKLVGLCDVSQTRMDFYNARIGKKFGAAPVPTFPAADFDRMIKTVKPDAVIVTTPDALHHIYAVRAMELGCDVICEKPLAAEAEQVKAIFDAIDRTGRSFRVTFNMRYGAPASRMRELVMQGVIGTPTAVDLSWVLDTSHGADYFRRWHAEKHMSGGLLVHKATHHFDIVNWWIASRPKTVFAMGDLRFYGRKNAEARGEKYSYQRYTDQPEAANDPFALRLDKNEMLKGLYQEAESETGYIRDRNVFGDHITIEDTMALTVRYHSGVIMNYSLIAYSPWEGMRVAITGTKGRIELFDQFSSHLVEHSEKKTREPTITVHPMFKEPYSEVIQTGKGGHGGSDAALLDHLFDPEGKSDPLGRAASHVDGAASAMVGICANISMKTGLPVQCDEVFPLPSTSRK